MGLGQYADRTCKQEERLAVSEVGDNVSDRRFLLETFGMFALEGIDGGTLGPEESDKLGGGGAASSLNYRKAYHG